MFTKPNLVATIATAIWSFMGGYFLWGILAEQNNLSGKFHQPIPPDHIFYAS